MWLKNLSHLLIRGVCGGEGGGGGSVGMVEIALVVGGEMQENLKTNT